jgi:hypothetical protein
LLVEGIACSGKCIQVGEKGHKGKQSKKCNADYENKNEVKMMMLHIKL